MPILDHPLNHKHGRAPQLRLWGLGTAGREDWGDAPVLLVVGATDVKFSQLLKRYQQLCDWVGPLPPAKFVNVDHGAQRFALFSLDPGQQQGACVTPALAHINQPRPGEATSAMFEVDGWAIKDLVGIAGVTVTLDGKPVAEATYGTRDAWVAGFWEGRSLDPNHPDVGFSAQVDASAIEPGHHWLGLTLHGADGSTEVWAEQPVDIGQ